MTEHDLMEAGDPTQTSGLSTPPRRDSMEDADSTGTLTRKRPRLDSGSRATRSMSEDVASTNDPQLPGTHTTEPVEVTINVRSHPPSSQTDTSHDLPAHVPGGVVDMSTPDSPPLVVDLGDDAGEDGLVTDSPPVEINLDGDTDDDYIGPQIVEDPPIISVVMCDFPFARQCGGIEKALPQLCDHVLNQDIVEPSLFPGLADWLNAYPSEKEYWLEFYTGAHKVWDDIGDFFRKILLRRYPLGPDFAPPGQTEEQVVRNCLQAYIRTCIRFAEIDVHLLEQQTGEVPADYHILCSKHLKNMLVVLRNDGNSLFRMLQKEYNQETHSIATCLVEEFIAHDLSGITQLVQLAELSWAKGPAHSRNFIAIHLVQLLEVVCVVLRETPDLAEKVNVSKLCDDILRVFRTYDTDLQASGKIMDVQFNKDMVLHCANLLKLAALFDQGYARELADEFMGFDGDSDCSTSSSPVGEDLTSTTPSAGYDPELHPALASNAWKFKLLRKYISKGRMELRVLCISTMDQQLVEVWKEYCGSRQGTEHPLMQYLAGYLLNGKVVDYIIGVDSHPQLISRSGNIVGFLVVTHRYTDKETDAIWRTITNSPDPRVVSATIAMLKQIINLMHPKDLSAMCGKLYQMPIESYTVEVLRFAGDITREIMQKARELIGPNVHPSPVQLFVRLMQDTAPSRTSTKLTTALYNQATEQLSSLSASVNIQERFKIYQSCVDNIASKSSKATGSIQAIFLLCKDTIFGDHIDLFNKLDMARHLILELCDYVKSGHSQDLANEAVALQIRLQLIAHIGIISPKSVPSELYPQLWDHIFGKYAWNNEMRDHAWWSIREAGQRRIRNEFCGRIISDLIPKLDPIYYTKGLFEFIVRFCFALEKKTMISDDGSTEVLEIPGASLLWPIVLNAPIKHVVELSARQLVMRYLDVYRAVGVTFEEVEEAHVALAEECAKKLRTSYQILRSGSTVESAGQGEQMAVVASDGELCIHERHFTRTLLFAKLFLTIIRTKPEFAHSPRTDSPTESVEHVLISGDPIQIRFQAGVGSSNEKQSIIAGKEDTLEELHDRLCRLIGFTKLRFIVKGKVLSIEDLADKQLQDINGIDWILIHRALDGEALKPETDSNVNCSIFESTILKHFEEMYSCMDSEDHISEAMYDFLFLLKPRDAIAESVAAGNALSTDIFPPGKVFQAKYAGLALHSRLRSQLNKGIVDENFLSNTVQLLDSALLNTELIGTSLTGKHDIPLASVLVKVLLGFLKERPLQDLSSNYFSDEKRLIDRLFSVIYKALETGDATIEPVYECYATILEAFLHSRKVWEAFISRQDFESLHKTILLVDGKTNLRNMVTQSIASICGGDLPSSSPLTANEIASVYWKTISSIIPHSIEYPSQSAELFDIAEQVFRRNDEYDRDELALRSFLGSWSSLLLNHRHAEFVGRDEIDTVVLGFTKLLLCCIQSLKSFKKPLDAGMLMEQTFHKFLFPPVVDLANEEHPNEGIILPVMNSETRKELYDLITALAEDKNSYELLLALTHSLIDEDEVQSSKSNFIDRGAEIRSSTGYVGLVNPRAICYMNSLLTQLFMHVNFREFMLNVNISDDRGSQRLLSDTQKLFAYMQNTYRKAADPRDFAACVKGLNSEPIDINIQMDADEFYNLLFDQWEGQMLSPATKQLFRSFYGGHTVNQIKSKECEHVSERVESFFVIQCDVQGKANLQESLQSFVEGDVMEGDNKYKCESCGGKFVDAVKRTCLKDVPDNLIFHLKRFDFDLIDMRRTKINDLFEFPSEIDVSPYNVDHLSDPEKPTQEDLFELVGVLVHQGNSENGHYYSFIRERPSASSSSQKWLEFNDRDVSDFEPSQIAYQAFGGLYDEQFQRQQKPFSAYMLFYQRKSAMDLDHQKFARTPFSGPPKVNIPADFEIDIAQDNETFVREYCLFDPNHSRFIRQILSTLRHVNNGICSDGHEQETLALGIAIQHINQIISHQKEISSFDEIMIQLKKTLQGCAICWKVAIRQMCSNEHSLIGLLLRCPHMRMRNQIRTFLLECLSNLRVTDTTLYGVDISDDDSETSLSSEDDGALAIVTQQLGFLTEHLPNGTRGWDDYFRLLCQIVNMGPHEAAAVLGNNLLVSCCSIFAMHAYPHLRTNSSLWRLVDKRKSVFNQMIELVYSLLDWIDLNAETVDDHQERLTAFDKATQKFPLTLQEKNLFFAWYDEHRAFCTIDMMIEKFDFSKSDRFWPGEILKKALAVDDPVIHGRLLHTLDEGLTQFTPPSNDPYVRAAISFCEGCGVPDEIAHLARLIAKQTMKLSTSGGDTRLEFFTHLHNMRNESTLRFDKPPEFFYELTISLAHLWAVGLLSYEDDAVRRNTLTLTEHLFLRVPLTGPNERQLKFIRSSCLRALLRNLCGRILKEYDNGVPRGYVQAMFLMSRTLMGSVGDWNHTEDEQMNDPGDLELLQLYNAVEHRIRNWPLEDESILSDNAYDGESQYENSDSDDPIDGER